MNHIPISRLTIKWNGYTIADKSNKECYSNMSNSRARRSDVYIQPCTNKEADDVFIQQYWMKRVRRSRRLSFAVFHCNKKVAWIQIAEPFGTRLTKPLQTFDIQEAVELCRGYFIDAAPANIESCAIGMALRLLPNTWYSSFGLIKKLAIVYQDLDVKQRGVVYRALGFKPYACCIRARHYTTPARSNSSGNKILWARGLKAVSGQHYKVLMPETISITSITLPNIEATDFTKSELQKSRAKSLRPEMIIESYPV
ncbi:hypothetical protein ACFLTV_00765 [Chloroflexota bacterium]